MPLLAIDCEGPITLNDNAFELAEEFIPRGGAFFERVSRYDDFLADVVKRPGYRAGYTLRLILPFFKAYGLTDELMEDFSERTVMMLPGGRALLKRLKEALPSFIVSTSYRPYLSALSRLTGFPMERIYCTEVRLDDWEITAGEKARLQERAREIAEMPLLEWPEGAAGAQDLSPGSKEVFERLEEIFWKEIPSMSIGRIYEEVFPVGGEEKARSLEDASRRTGIPLGDAVYIGDSITDVQALRRVKKEGGKAVSFNGNRYAVREADLAAVSKDTWVTEALAKAFSIHGRSAFERLEARMEKGVLAGDALQEALLEIAGPEVSAPPSGAALEAELHLVEPRRLDYIIERSETARRTVRGERIGGLG